LIPRAARAASPTQKKEMRPPIFIPSKIFLAFALLCLPCAAARAQQTFNGSAEIVPQQVDRIYLKGLAWLARNQSAEGDWPDAGAGEPAITGLAIVSLLAHGDDPNFGPYNLAVHRGLDYILKHQDEKTGYIGPSMYNHGFATLALAESYGTVDDPRLGPALKRAVGLILTAQSVNNSKAWRYMPESTDADTTVSGANMVALLAARNAGVPVPQKNIQQGLQFYYSCQTPDGGVGYVSAQGPNATRTAIACLVMALAKEKKSTPFRAAFQFLKSTPADMSYPGYFRYYASQAFFHGSPELWETWNHENIKTLAATQLPDGSWEGQFGSTFNTATSLLSLALNYRYLPIYER
jgi:hypothetical protein